MKRSNKLYIDDMVESISKIQKYTNGLSFEQFEDSSLIIDATLRNLEVLGVAAGKVNNEIKNFYHDVPWRQMSDLRNIVIHEYFGVDLNIIWQIVHVELPKILPSLKNIEVD